MRLFKVIFTFFVLIYLYLVPQASNAQCNEYMAGATSVAQGSTRTYTIYDFSVTSWTVMPTTGRTINSSNSTNTSVTWNTAGTYTVTGSGSGLCASLTITVSAGCPTTPVVTNASLSTTVGCAVPMSIQSPNGSLVYRWYNSATGGVLLSTGTTYNYTNANAGNYNIYAAAYSASANCESSTRALVSVSVVSPNAVISTTSTLVGCNTSLTVQNPLANYTYRWYNASNGGTLLGTGNTLQYANSVAGTHNVYLTAVHNSTSCESSPRTNAVAVTVTAPSATTTSASGLTGCSIPLSVQSPSANFTYKWYATATGGIPLSQSNTFSYSSTTAGTYPIYLTATNNTTNCESSPRVLATTVTLSGINAPIVNGNPRATFSGNLISLQVTNVQAGVSYSWWDGSTQLNSLNNYNYTASSTPNPQNVFTVKATACGVTTSTNVTVNNYSLPAIVCPLPVTNDIVYLGNTNTTLSLSSTYPTTAWYKDGVLVGANNTLVVSASGVYHAVVTIYDNGAPVTRTTTTITIEKGFQDMNYTISRTILKDNVKLESEIDNLPIGEKTEVTTYFDGLGRPIQKVATKASPFQLDIVQPIAYDQFGRIEKQFLPYTGGNTGRYQQEALLANYTDSKQYKFYTQDATANGVPFDTKPFAKVEYEASPMNRVTKSWGVGMAWHDNNKFSQSDYKIYQNNGTDIVPIWEVNYSNNTFTKTGEYASNTLIVTEATDEDGAVIGSKIQVYTNTLGQTVLKRAFGDNGEVLETMYVYDDFGQLRATLPPMAVDLLKANGWNLNAIVTNTTTSIINTYCFTYNYDARGRQIEIREPQTKMKNIVYDELDRPILTQDGNQKAQGQWSFTKFDIYSRPILTGLMGDGSTREEVQTYVNQHFNGNPANLYEVRSNTYVWQTGSYYTDNAYPAFLSGASSDVKHIYHTITHYDDYDFNNDGVVNAQDANNKLYVVKANYHNGNFTRLKGKITGSRVLVLDGNSEIFTWLYTVPYYDDRGRIIQIQGDNHLLNSAQGTDVFNAKYSYVRLEEDHVAHTDGTNPVEITQKYTYDFIGRPIKTEHQITYQGVANPWERVASYTYNELGQVVKKKVGNNDLQEIDYGFNIRGALKRINDANLTNNKDLFGFELFYEEANSDMDLSGSAANGAGKAHFNGLIAGQKWKTALDNEQRAYSYEYDRYGRLKQAKYRNISKPTSLENFTVDNITYDKNGNIRSMRRHGLTSVATPTLANPTGFVFGVVDNLTYVYKGNQLAAVNDLAVTTGVAGDFLDRGSNASGLENEAEYNYDDNGNVIEDGNRKIKSIIYNHFTKPEIITYENSNGVISGSIRYIYDGAGIKLSKTVYDGNYYVISQNDYLGGMLYEGGQLQFISMPEGKAIAPNRMNNQSATFAYEYQYTDHLGNLRMTFREGVNSAPMKATMEDANKLSEETEFANIALTRNGEKAKAGTKSAKLNASAGKPLGPWKSMSVQIGDVLNINTSAFYHNQTNSDYTFASLLSVLGSSMANYAVQTPQNGENQTQKFPLTNLTVGLVTTFGANQNQNTKIPDAYLALMFYNEQGDIVPQHCQRIQLQGNALNGQWQDLSISNYSVPAKGRVEIFVANTGNANVWFDDLEIKHKGAIIAQETHYDPWGLELAGIGRQGLNRFTFNGQSEKQANLSDGKGYFYETDFRGYDATLGRFHAYDLMASKYGGITPYHYALNNPIGFNDPTGLEGKPVLDPLPKPIPKPFDPSEIPKPKPGEPEPSQDEPPATKYVIETRESKIAERFDIPTGWGNAGPDSMIDPVDDSHYIELVGQISFDNKSKLKPYEKQYGFHPKHHKRDAYGYAVSITDYRDPIFGGLTSSTTSFIARLTWDRPTKDRTAMLNNVQLEVSFPVLGEGGAIDNLVNYNYLGTEERFIDGKMRTVGVHEFVFKPSYNPGTSTTSETTIVGNLVIGNDKANGGGGYEGKTSNTQQHQPGNAPSITVVFYTY